MDPAHAASVQTTLAVARAVGAAISLCVLWIDPPAPAAAATAAIGLVLAFTIYSVTTLALTRLRPARVARHWVRSHVIDLACITAVTWLTGGVFSPFFTFFIFALLSAGYRWGLRATMVTAYSGVAILLAETVSARWGFPVGGSHPDMFILRTGYLLLGGALVGALAEQEHKLRISASAVTRIMSMVRMEAGLVASVEAVLDELTAHFSAGRAVLVLEEDDSERVLLWEVSREGAGRRKTVRPLYLDRAHARPYLFPVSAGVDAWYTGRSTRADDAGSMRTTAIDAFGRRAAGQPTVESLTGLGAPWHSVHGLSSIAGTGWKGRLLIFDGSAFRHVEDDLKFLQTVGRQIGPALFNLYLQRRLQSRVGVAERVRVARKLHDGIIQSLVGFEMQLDVLCRTAGDRVPRATVDQLEAIQRLLGDEIHNVRDLMQLLRPVDVNPKQLIEYLSDLVERFQYRTGIQARFVCDVDEITLPPRVCRELAGAIQEALTNVRKHSGARRVHVQVAATENQWRFTVEDDGKGFDFDGRLTLEELDAQRCGPAQLKERLRAIGASLTIHSRCGYDARLEISIPRPNHA